MRPRILLVPSLTELEWRIAPLLEQWADVATFDVPGVGDEPPVQQPGLDAIVDRGLAELDRRGWERCVVAGDEFGAIGAIHVAARRPESVAGLALGHGCVRIEREGPRPTISTEVMGAFAHLLGTDYRTYIRHLTQLTQGAYDDELAERFLARIPQQVAADYEGFFEQGGDTIEMVRSLGVPLLLAKHSGCLGFTEEGWEDAAAAFPEAMRTASKVKPSADPGFADALERFSTPLFASA